jgi:RNA polymerase sigma-70 factor (ECF subfamily)
MVLRAQTEGHEAVKAMNELCRRYWYPSYAYLRFRRISREDAQDITQTFFLKIATGSLIQRADQERGRLRSFLLLALNRHLSNHVRYANAQKRGGRAIVLPLECHTAEERFALEPTDTRDPEKLYYAAWARELMARVRRKLREHYERSQRGAMFEALDSFLGLDESRTPYRELAERLRASEAALRVQMFRLRQRFAKTFREEVALTVQSPSELEEEMAWLAGILREG